MKLLSKEELKKAEKALRHYFPQSQQVYGYVSAINRVEADPSDVLVDQWPDFDVLLIKPRRRKKPDFLKDVCIFTKDKTSLMNILFRTDILDWKQYQCLSADLQYEEPLMAVAMNKFVPMENICSCNLLHLQDPSKLTLDRSSVQVSPLKESHIALVCSTWKFNMGNLTEPMIRNMVLNFPSYCVLDAEGRPISWILTYESCAMGMLYTLPEHRRKGYAKVLVNVLAKKLHSEGYPVYCFIEEENQASYKLFTSLGFTEVPSYRHAWFSVNEMSITESVL